MEIKYVMKRERLFEGWQSLGYKLQTISGAVQNKFENQEDMEYSFKEFLTYCKEFEKEYLALKNATNSFFEASRPHYRCINCGKLIDKEWDCGCDLNIK